MIRLAIRQPVTVTVGVILIVLAGIISLSRLPIQLTPNVEVLVITVTTFWEGASPEEIEINVVDKQEERLTSLSNLKSITSSSKQNQGFIRLEFHTGTDKKEALREVTQRLNEVPVYPEGVDEPVIAATDRENRDYIAWIMFGSTDPDFDVRTLRDFALDRIEPTLERVPGIAEINVLGGREREIHVIVDPVALAQYGVTPTQFAMAVRQTNRDVSAGRVPMGKSDVTLRVVNQYETMDDVEDTIIAHTEAGPVFLRDVAKVEDGFKEPLSFVRSQGRPVIAINAEREIGSNVMDVMDGLKAELARLNADGGLLEAEARRLELDGDLYLEQAYDQTLYIDDALSLVRNNIFIGGALAFMVLILFLRSLRSTGVVILAIPISVIGAIVAMVAVGRSMNVISLAGMAFAVGMVVDNAIVVLENIFRHLEMGKKPREAALHGAREVWGAVLASTLTTVMVFIPILLVEEEAGQLFRDIALAICAAVLLSLLVSITVIPCAAARVLRSRKTNHDAHAHHRLARFVGRLIYRLCAPNATGVATRLIVIAGLTTASIIGTIKLMPASDYLPTGNRNLVFGFIVTPPGYNIEQMGNLGDRLEATVRPFWEAGELFEQWRTAEESGDDQLAVRAREAYDEAVDNLPEIPTFNWMTQSAGDPVVPPSIGNYFVVAFEGLLFHGAISDDETRVVDVLTLLTHAGRSEALPGTLAYAFQMPLFQLGGATGSAIKLEFSGPDLDQVVAVTGEMFSALGANYGYGAVRPEPGNFMLNAPEVQVEPDELRLSEVGMTTDDVGYAVRASGDGAIIDEFQLAGESIDLKVISADAVNEQGFEKLGDVPVATPSGHVVPLGSLAHILLTYEPEEIQRVGRQRAVTLQVTPPRGMALEQMVAEMNAMIAERRASGMIPPTVETDLSGSASKLEAVRNALLGDGTLFGTITSSLVLALLVVYLLMCVLFQSFVRPLVIMFSVPLATLGGFAALFAVSIWSFMDPYMPIQKLDVLTMLGFVILIGVVVNNAILIVHQSLNFLRGAADTDAEFEGEMTPRRAIAEAVRTRVRPIFMSTLTSVGGMLPLVLMPGSGSELYRGLGSVVIGGLLVSTIFTLLLVPLLLSLVFDIQQLFRREEPVVAPVAEPVIEPRPKPETVGAVGAAK